MTELKDTIALSLIHVINLITDIPKSRIVEDQQNAVKAGQQFVTYKFDSYGQYSTMFDGIIFKDGIRNQLKHRKWIIELNSFGKSAYIKMMKIHDAFNNKKSISSFLNNAGINIIETSNVTNLTFLEDTRHQGRGFLELMINTFEVSKESADWFNKLGLAFEVNTFKPDVVPEKIVEIETVLPESLASPTEIALLINQISSVLSGLIAIDDGSFIIGNNGEYVNI